MDVILLGAGKPASGHKPSSLKYIAQNTNAMDWQLNSFQSLNEVGGMYYVGGYHIDEITSKYPNLKYTVVPEWDRKSVMYSLLSVPFSNKAALISYSDTIFRPQIIKNMLLEKADVVFGVDSNWTERYDNRTQDDIDAAETIEVEGPDGQSVSREFTGLIRLSAEAVEFVKAIKEKNVGASLVHLISHLENSGFSVKPFDVAGNWAEFNSPNDIAKFVLGTKAETLARLESVVKKCHIGKQVCFTASQWNEDRKSVLKSIETSFGNAPLIIRSSSKGEDNWEHSNAGGFESILNVDGSSPKYITDAVGQVISSYGQSQDGHDQVLVQEFMRDVALAGVVFTCGLETGSPYYRFNFDDKSKSTESVTSGANSDLRTVIVSRFGTQYLQDTAAELTPVLDALEELEGLLGFDKLDVEFAIGTDGRVHIFQVRPITVDHSEYEVDFDLIENNLDVAADHFESQQDPSPFVFGDKAIYGNMPDWNPAEIIGTRPKPLSFSLYRYLITNDVWAVQRAEFGYRNVNPLPLISSFVGQPYVDARASLNSFIPADVREETAKSVATAYIELLANSPKSHDKIEFDIAFTVWTPDFCEKAKSKLKPLGVNESQISELECALQKLTCRALIRLEEDIKSVDILEDRRVKILGSTLNSVDKACALLADCRTYGTLAFAHAARAGFVAATLLKSLVDIGSLTEERRLEFLKSFPTVAGEFEASKHGVYSGALTYAELTEMFGHLRPGTYEVTEKAYWEDANKYLAVDQPIEIVASKTFRLSAGEEKAIGKMLLELGSELSAASFFEYAKNATQAREHVKFLFSKNLSAALDSIVEFGTELGLDRSRVSYLTFDDIFHLKLNSVTLQEINRRIDERLKNQIMTNLVELPALISRRRDFYCFERFSSQPNFVTNGIAEGGVQLLDADSNLDLAGSVALIPQADPGYDWLFGRGIIGLVTQYGGANSHMAIRASEIGLPSAIGVGTKLYEEIARMKRIRLDCANQTIREII